MYALRVANPSATLRSLAKSSINTQNVKGLFQRGGNKINKNNYLQQRFNATSAVESPFAAHDTFARRHIGPRDAEIKDMLKFLGYDSLEAFTKENVPKSIALNRPLNIEKELGEKEMLEELKKVASKNQLLRSFIGLGYHGTITPPVIQRNILENPGWYTAYTPYQAEISQGRLEMLLNFQTLVTDLTGLDVANASLLDEATAAAEAMHVVWVQHRKKKNTFYVANDVHPQTIGVIQTRAKGLGIKVVVGEANSFDFSKGEVCGVMVQYPATDGRIVDYSGLTEKAHQAGAFVVMGTDLLALTVLKSPGELGADVALGNSQRFGVPMGYGGPHAAFFAVKDTLKRHMPGRLIGVSKDLNGDLAYRMSLQSREQHIRRETATSNICTAQALLSNMAAAYAIYHGPEGIKKIGQKVHQVTSVFATGVSKLGYTVPNQFFDTIRINLKGKTTANELMSVLVKKGINIRKLNDNEVSVALDETTTEKDVSLLLEGFAEAAKGKLNFTPSSIVKDSPPRLGNFTRTTKYLTHPVFNSYHSETEMLRYLKRLENKDFSLTHGMIPLGSCTMKLNATSEMIPVTWPEFGGIHPFAPIEQAKGYNEMFESLVKSLCEITGFSAFSLQPNSGAQGEYAGLVTIREYLEAKGQSHRNICLIPVSAHGTNPASAAMAGMKIVPIKTDGDGNVDIADLKEKVQQNSKELACLMVTYPSTYGVFEEGIKEICKIVHDNGGQVYMDGANMNSQVGLCRPGDIGADVVHLNLHKTFCIPHGGGGPGMGPIGVAKHLEPYLPGHPVVHPGKFGGKAGPVSAAPFGSSAILPISHVYIKMMGPDGLKKATQIAILNANYIAKRLKDHYPIRYHKRGLVAHECIIDISPFKAVGVEVEDVAKRLADYGFHAPTVAWPIHDTIMPEPTESESKQELDKFCDALISIREEIRQIEQGKIAAKDSALKNAPHTLKSVTVENWNKAYTREQAAFPTVWTKKSKYWPTVGRIDNAYGDRHLVCTCPPMEDIIASQS